MTKQERAARTRQALLESAADLFERRGYAQARLAEISSGAGVSPGALHFHFESKAAVAAAITEVATRTLHHSASRIRRAEGCALQNLTDLSHVFALLLYENTVVRAGYRLSCDPVVNAGPNLRQKWQSCVRSLLARAGDEGTLTAHVPQETLLAAIVAATTGFEVLAGDDSAWLSHQAVTSFWRVVLPSVAAPHTLVMLNAGGTDSVVRPEADPWRLRAGYRQWHRHTAP